MKLLRRKKFVIPAIAGIVALIGAGVAYGFFTSSGGGTGGATVGSGSTVNITQLPPNSATLYDSVISPLPGNLPSEGFQSDSVTELGNEINLVSSGQELSSVVVTMSSWACGNWQAINADTSTTCTTTPGSTYAVPITLYIYNVGAGNTVGSFIASDTQTFNIPFRPSATVSCPIGDNDGQWYDSVTATCNNGLATNITFNGVSFSTPNITLPGSVIYGIAYNTDTHGLSPTGSPGPVDSLNVSLSQDPTNVTVGSDPIFGSDWLNSSNSIFYCDDTVTPGTFQLDALPGSGTCTGADAINSPPPSATTYYVPAVQFNGLASGYFSLLPGGPAEAVDFSVANTGSSPAYVEGVTFAITGISGPHTSGVDGDCPASWFALTQPSVPVDVTIPVSGSVSYQPSGGLIALTETHTNQDACENATLVLTFTSS